MMVLVLVGVVAVQATVKVDNCDCFENAVQDQAAALLNAADSHAAATGTLSSARAGAARKRREGADSGEAGEELHTVDSVADGLACKPEVQFDGFRGMEFDEGNADETIDLAEAKCTEERLRLDVKLGRSKDIRKWTAASAQECSQLCLRCGCKGFNYGNKTDGCFPADATLELQGGATVAMDALKVGDVVRVGAGAGVEAFSKVYMFTHKDADVKAKFVKIMISSTTTTTKQSVRLTAGHYLYVNGKLQTARTVKVGDTVSAGNVTAVTTEWAEGFYNPHTMTGDIVVNGVLTSTYTDAVAPSLAHALLWPARMLYEHGVQLGGDDWNQGGGKWTALAAMFGLKGEDSELYNGAQL